MRLRGWENAEEEDEKNDNGELVVRAANRRDETFLFHRSMEGVVLAVVGSVWIISGVGENNYKIDKRQQKKACQQRALLQLQVEVDKSQGLGTLEVLKLALLSISSQALQVG